MCMYICIHIHTDVFMDVCYRYPGTKDISTHIYKYCMSVYLSIYLSVYLYIYIDIYRYIRVGMYVWVLSYMYYLCMYIYIYMCVCVCIYIYICTNLFLDTYMRYVCSQNTKANGASWRPGGAAGIPAPTTLWDHLLLRV